LIVVVIITPCFGIDGKRIEDYSTGLRPWEQKQLDSLFDEIVEDIYQNFKGIPEQKLLDEEDNPIKKVGIWPFQDDIEFKFYNRFRQKVLSGSPFRVYERKDVENLLQEQGLQNTDIYKKDDQMEIGRLTQWNGLIYGKVTLSAENLFGKRKIYLNADCHFNNIESGEVIWTNTFSNYYKPQLPLQFYLYGLLMLLVLLIGFNIATKGRKVSLWVGIFVALAVLYTIWFYVI
jgi:hypothetical protein